MIDEIMKSYSLSHDQVALGIWLRCQPRMLKVDEAPWVSIKAKYPALTNNDEIE